MKKILFLLALFFSFNISSALPPDEMTGQMILVGFKGDNINSKEYKEAKKQLELGKIGGVILFEFNVKDEKQLKALISDLNNTETKLKPFVGIDQEGGRIQILNEKNGFKNYLGAFDTAKKLTLKEAYNSYYDLSHTLNESGFNLNFAPVVDLAVNPDSIVIQKGRAYSENAKVTTAYAKQFINANDKNNIISTLKHFPGHGSPSGDTHKGFVDASKTWDETELIPYKNLLRESELEMVMSSHVFIDKLDKDYPASLSQNIIQGILREKLGYQGVVITDDLYMGAVSNNYSLNDIVIKGINAGNDILLFSNYDSSDMKLPDKINKIVKKAIKEGKIKEERIYESYNRIADLKKKLQKRTLYSDIIKHYENKTPKQWGERTEGVMRRIKTKEKILALTLDACGSKTDSLDLNLINFLTENKIPATMFVTKRWINKYPEYFKMLSQNPLFEIENHGASHKPASVNGKSIYNIEGTKNPGEFIDEVEENGKYIEKLTGRKPLFYRSGTAYYDEYAVKIANELGYQVIGFNILGDRGATYSEKQVTRALLKAKSGDIIICHMNHPEKETGAGLMNVLPKLLKKGYRFVRLEDYKNLLY